MFVNDEPEYDLQKFKAELLWSIRQDLHRDEPFRQKALRLNEQIPFMGCHYLNNTKGHFYISGRLVWLSWSLS